MPPVPTRISSDCSVGEECPSLDRRRAGWIEVTGYPVDSSGRRVHDDDTETTVEVPDTLLGEVADLAVTDLGGFIAARHRTDLLRVQTLDRYDVASDGDDFERWRSGTEFRPSEARVAWAERLRADVRAGKRRRNVHIVREPLSDYLRYQFAWGYTYNAAAGQDIRIVVVGDTPAAARLVDAGDFTVVEHREVVRNRYTSDGKFVGAVRASSDAAPVHAALAELVWESGVPFADWWARHPQYHRAVHAA